MYMRFMKIFATGLISSVLTLSSLSDYETVPEVTIDRPSVSHYEVYPKPTTETSSTTTTATTETTTTTTETTTTTTEPVTTTEESAIDEVIIEDVYVEEVIEEDTEPEIVEVVTEEVVYDNSTSDYNDYEVDLIALVTMAEAEGESEEGQRLVIDVILNRVDSGYFPNTIYDVIYEPYQFTSMTNGRADRCYVTDELRQLVREEMENRTNYDVTFFTAGYYSDYGTPLFSVGNHYFSSYN